MKNKIFYVLLVVIFVAGLSLLLYPTVSNAYNNWIQSRAIVEYSQEVSQLSQETARAELEKAQQYNRELLDRDDPFGLPEDLKAQYPTMLKMSKQEVMGYVQIPSISVLLPIAHGTSDEVLRDKIGHLEWSSLPVGGENTHCVISGHRGLPSAELFTNIDHLELGDKFYINALGQSLEYQVCNIAVVEPSDQRLLRIVEGKDLVTLVTCTPYGINSHRLLVQGIRSGTQTGNEQHLLIKNEVTQVDLVILISVLLVAVAVVAFLILMVSNKKKKGGQPDEKKTP